VHSVNEFWAIDFDRCIGNVDKIYQLFERLLCETIETVDITALESARFEIESVGGSFDMLAYVRQHTTNEEAYQVLIHAFLIEASQVRDSLFMPGVYELVRYLERQLLPYGIVSFGHQDWQTLKITAMGLGDVPRLIVDQSHKGEIIGTWQASEGFVIPTALGGGNALMSESIVLVDDKAISFAGLPESARGYWVRSTDLLQSQRGTIPNSVIPVEALDEIVAIEQSTALDK